MKPQLGFLHPAHVLRTADKQQPGKDFLYEGTRLRKRKAWSNARAPAFGLQKRVGDGADRHVVLPARIRAAFEMIEPEFGLQVLVMLFDRPAVMRQSHERLERGRRRQRHEVVSTAARRAEAAFAEQPDLWREPTMTPIGCWRDADRGKVRF